MSATAIQEGCGCRFDDVTGLQVERCTEHTPTICDHDFVPNDRPEWSCWMACGYHRENHPKKGEPWPKDEDEGYPLSRGDA